MISCHWFRGGRDGDVDADGVVAGCQLLAVVGDCVEGHICWASVGSVVGWDEVGRFKKDICWVSYNSR